VSAEADPGSQPDAEVGAGSDAVRSAAGPGWREVLRHRGRLTVGLVLLETVTAIQMLVVVTIMPAVLRDLGGLSLYGWAFSAEALAAMIALPVTGRTADRRGPAKGLVVVMVIFTVGSVVAALATSMPMFVVGRFLQGWGLGAQYAVSLGAVAKTYPEAYRPKLIALLTAAWVVPSVVGPPVGALFASTIGWRWVLVVSLPIVAVAAWLALPELRGTPPPDRETTPVGLQWIVLLAVGATLLLGALTNLTLWTAPAAAAGVAALVPALRRILPPGTFRARTPLAASAAAAFLLAFAFFGTDSFIPLLLTHVRGRSIAEAGIVVTLSSLAWALGTWWQSRAIAHRSPRSLALVGSALALIGVAGIWVSVDRAAPLALVYVAWTIGGAGMGIAYPVVPLVAMERSEGSGQIATIASVQLAEAMGGALGPGLGGSAIALASGAGASLTAGLSGAFGLALGGGLLLLPVTVRLPGASAGASRSAP
jgi:MFS family permease